MASPPPPLSPYRRHFAELDQSATMHAEPLRRCALLIAVGTGVAACFASEVFYEWAFNLPLWTGPLRDGVLAVAEAWHSLMMAIGLTEVRETLGNVLRWFQQWQSYSTGG